MTGYVLAVDGGQTSTKAALASADGRILKLARVGPWDLVTHPGGAERCRRALSDLLEALLPAAPAGDPCLAACLGLTGGSVGADQIARWLYERVRPAHLTIVGDPVTSLRAADPSGGPGVVVIAGGGSVAWGRNAAGKEALAGAHGYLLDDEGSAYELGRQAIIAVLKADHGRRPPTLLTRAVLQHLGVASPYEARMAVYDGRADRRHIAGLFPAIVDAARAGDAAAQAILEAGAAALAEMAAAVLARLQLPHGPVYPTGGVFAAGAPVLAPFAAALARLAPGARVERPRLEPLGGAVVMALEQAGVLTAAAVEQVAAALAHRPPQGGG